MQGTGCRLVRIVCLIEGNVLIDQAPSQGVLSNSCPGLGDPPIHLSICPSVHPSLELAVPGRSGTCSGALNSWPFQQPWPTELGDLGIELAVGSLSRTSPCGGSGHGAWKWATALLLLGHPVGETTMGAGLWGGMGCVSHIKDNPFPKLPIAIVCVGQAKAQLQVQQ